MGVYAPAQIVHDTQEHGVEVRAVDVNASNWDCTLEDGRKAAGHLYPRHADMKTDIHSDKALRLGFRQISGFSEDEARLIEALRGNGFDLGRALLVGTR